jgi:hypothetical protein
LIINDAAEAKSFVIIQACLAGEVASVSIHDFVGISPANSSVEVISFHA